MQAFTRTQVKLKGKRFSVLRATDGSLLKVTYISPFSGEREVKLSSRTAAELAALLESRLAHRTS